MAMQTPRRLPGFRFEAQSPPLTEVLPRMDVAVFVGFAASGPLHRPVAVEDVAQFTAIFGDDAPLAWDAGRGEQVYAYLGPAVRAFFRNGGRRCWIIRVAGAAQSNYFPIPGLARFAHGRITPAFAPARSEGSWPDSLRVSAALLSLPLEVMGLSLDNLWFDVALASPQQIAVGDLLRLTFPREGYVLMVTVRSIEPGAASAAISTSSPTGRSGRPRSRVRVRGGAALWFKVPDRPLPALAQARVFTHASESEPLSVSVHEEPSGGVNQSVHMDLQWTVAQAPVRGSLIRIDFEEGQFWLMVQDLTLIRAEGSPLGERVRLTGRGLWWLKDPPSVLLASPPAGERLSFELWAQPHSGYPMRLPDLAFTAAHARFWGALPTDEELYRDAESPARPASNYTELWRAAAHPRFPLAGDPAPSAFYFPIGMPILPEPFLGRDPVTGSARARDGLASFHSGLFLDRHLSAFLTESLMTQADFVRYQSSSPRALRGIHAALGIEEATLIAVPDAIHRGWLQLGPDALLPPAEVPPRPHPEWWRFLDCDPAPDIPLARTPQWGNFLDCSVRVIKAPELRRSDAPAQTGTFTLTWSAQTGARYILEESTRPDFGDAVVIYAGTSDRKGIYGYSPGDYYYRVRAEVGGLSSDWSNGVGVRVAPASPWQMSTVQSYTADTLLAVQRALLRMCAARGDLFAVLALPEHYCENDALAHVAGLKASLPTASAAGDVMPLSYGEALAFSYGAVYHPWLIRREERLPSHFKRTPPDGAACGILAKRSIERGAWIAPANELLREVVALTPPILRERWLSLQEAQLNVIRQEPRGFLSLSADTLSDDPDLRPIGVRRLLMLLRRLALRLGANYVFEPNDASFRRLVQRGFEGMLNQMFVRGAFAGATSPAAFQVIVSDSLNTPASVEQGRFVVELRVAPSRPLTFLTIRLVQTGDRGFVTEGR